MISAWCLWIIMNPGKQHSDDVGILCQTTLQSRVLISFNKSKLHTLTRAHPNLLLPLKKLKLNVLLYPCCLHLSILQITQLFEFSAGLRQKNFRLFHRVAKELGKKIAYAKPNWHQGIISDFWKKCLCMTALAAWLAERLKNAAGWAVSQFSV